MARKKTKKSLYELFKTENLKSVYNGDLGKSPEETPETEEKEVIIEEKAAIAEDQEVKIEKKPVIQKKIIVEEEISAEQWPQKAKAVRFINSRFEFSLHYSVAVVIILVLFIVMLLCFQIGQGYNSQSTEKQPAKETAKTPTDDKDSSSGKYERTGNFNFAGSGVVDDTVSNQSGNEISQPGNTDEPTGSNRIVIKGYYPFKKDLEEAKAFFDKNKIETEIQKRGDNYFLVTKKSDYWNPERQGSDGYVAKQKIIEIGTKYKKLDIRDPFGEKAR